MRRNDTSPFGDGFPAHYSGYTKNYRYNDNLLCDGSKPPFFPKTEEDCGEETELKISSYGND